MKYIKKQVLHDRKIGDRQLVITGDGNIELTPNSGVVSINGDLRVTGTATGAVNELIYYVSLDGDDTNDGLGGSSDRAKRTIKSAVAAAPEGATIKLAPGDFYEDNPITLKRRQTVRGDSLRNCQVWPLNKGKDFFFIDNACYIFQITFRGMSDPGWCVRISPGALVTTSPYVQNCSNINGPWLNDGTEFIPYETIQIEGYAPESRPIINNPEVPLGKRVNETGGGNGMLVDGNDYDQRSLVFSMVADAFTQIAQGGIGYHITNFGYTQIVSCFTVFCRTGFLATNGGYLSISNSVSDFGTFGIIADGLFDKIYTTARPTQDYYSTVGSATVNSPGAGYTSAPVVTIDPPTTLGGVQAVATAGIDATTGKLTSVAIDNPGSGYDFVPTITFTGGGFSLQATATTNLTTNKVITVSSLRDQPQVGSIIQFVGDSTKYYVTSTNVTTQPFVYNETVCRRDVRRMVDAIAGDMVMGTNYQALAAGRSYLRSTSTKVLQQQLAPTVFGLEAARDEVLARIPDINPTNQAARYAIIEGFATAINIIEQGDSTATPDLLLNDLVTIDSGVITAKDNILANREFIVNEITAYISEQFTDLSYNQTTFEKDITQITIGNSYDVAIGTNYNAVVSGITYSRGSSTSIEGRLKTQTIAALEYLKGRITDLSAVSANAIATTRAEANINEIVDIINGLDYDQAICRRDIGYIIESTAWDAALGTNYNAVTTGLSYQRAPSAYVLSDQFQQTIGAIEYLKTVAATYLSANATAVARSDAAFDEILDIIENGVVNADTLTWTDPGVNANKAFARILLQLNREFISSELTIWINSNFPLLTYNVETCRRDVEYIVDALSFDVQYNGNFATSRAADAYFSSAVSVLPVDQKAATAAAMAQLAIIVADIVEEGYAGQTTTGNPASATEATEVDGLVQIIEDVVTADSLSGLPALVEPSTTWVTTGIANAVNLYKDLNSQNLIKDDVIEQINVSITNADSISWNEPTGVVVTRANAKDQLAANRTFIVEDVIAYFNATNPEVVYDEKRFRRDTGYIVDALIYDVLYGSTSATIQAAQSYFTVTLSQLGVEQTFATIESYSRLQSLVSSIVQGQLVTPTTGNILTQDTSSNNASGVESDKLTRLIQYVIDVMEAGSVDVLPAVTYPLISWVFGEIIDASTAIYAQRNNFASDTTDWILANYPDFTYDRVKCKRDVSLIVDAIARDIRLNTNHNTIVAGNAYRRGTASVVDAGQLPATIMAIRYLGTLIEDAVASSPTLVPRVTDRIEILTTIMEYGTQPSEGTTYPAPSIASQELIDSARQLQDNRTFLIEETIAYTNFTYGSLVYDEAKCRRDTGYLIDAVTHDMLYGGNRSILISARSYFDDGASQIIGQESETIASLEHLKTVSTSVIEGIAVTPTTGNSESQVLDAAFGTSTQSTISEGLYDVVINAITAGNLVGTPSNSDPDYNWLPAAIQEAANNLISLNATLQQQVIDYITNNIISFSYNVAKCQRDTSYIIDAALYDMMYGGNKQTRRAAEAYYSNAVIVGQESITEFTYKYLALVLSNVAQDIAVTPSFGNITSQVISGNAGSSAAGAYIFTMVEKIADVIRLGSTSFLPTEENHYYSTLGDTDLNVRREIILADLAAIEDESIRLLNLEFGGVAELTLFPGVRSVVENTLGSMQNVSTVSTSGHAFEYVGAGITYNALPFFGGSPIPENEIIETDSGKVFAGGTVDQIGNFRVGNFFQVNALTGAITLNANEINLSGLSSIGPFQRDGIPVGVQLKEVSNSTNLVSSLGQPDQNTVPTQLAVVSYVENRYLNKLTGGTVNGDVTFAENITVDGGNLTTISTTFSLIDDNANIVNFAGGATEINIGAPIGTTTINNDVVIDGTADITGDVSIIGDFNLTIPDEVSQAFNVSQGTEDYISIDTRTNLEVVAFGSAPRVEINNTTQSDTGTVNTGALVVAGGIGITKNLNVGGDIYFEGTIISTSSSSLSLFNDVAGSVDMLGAATEINIGSAGITPGTFTVNNDYIEFTSVYNLVLPSGVTGERGISASGAIRFNTTLGQFEGYDGIAWNTLGGVRDVDGNTYILPETSPGSNENDLMFYTDGLERMVLGNGRLRVDNTITYVHIEGTTESTSPDTGQLVVEGGVGIEKNLNVRGNARIYNNALIEGNTTITGDLTVGTFDSVVDTVTFNANAVLNVWDNTVQAFEVLEGANSYFKITTTDGNEVAEFNIPRVLINNTTESTDFETGAVVIAGGVGIAGNLNVAGGFNVSGSITFGDDVENDTFTVVGDTDFTIPDNTVDSFRIREGTSTYLTFTTTNGSEVAEFGTVPQVVINNTTDSSNKDTGALVVDGGVGIELNANIGIDLNVGRNTVLTGDLAVNGGDLTTTAATFSLLNANATTVNFAGNATAINVGASTGLVTFNNQQVIFNSVKTIQIPVGSTADRPTAATGQLRFNSDTTVFEGYDGNVWGSLGGVKDVDQNTFIRPETTPGANNDELEFFTNGAQRAIIGNTYFNINDTVVTTFNNTTVSSNFQTGSVVVVGGVGIGEELHVNKYIGGNTAGVLQLTNYASDKILINAATIESPEEIRWIANSPDSSADDIVYPVSFAHHTLSGTPVIGSGTGIKFELETTNDNFETGGQIAVVVQDITGDQEDFDMIFSTMIAGSAGVEKLRLGETTSTFSTDITINNNQLLTTQTAFNLLNDTATTINFAGAATVLNIGATGGLTTIDQSVQVNEDVTIDGTLVLTNIDLEVQYGGTGVSAFTENGIVYGDTANPMKVTDAAGTSDASNSFQILTVTSAVDATPVWTDTIDGGTF